ncbi:fatty acyl-AMP ligase [Streptomyces geranii]|uniref:fatty acyl-AMP ligase n=1 Tax=Streptomyces geranii TaxID=2058923 RepID=UPI0018E4E34A|nr:fatty acyl-AMP ligase [Streptomyces geranii]
MPDLLIRRAEAEPESVAYSLLDWSVEEGGRERMRVRQLGYGELDRAARRLAGWLLERGLRGERVLVLQQRPESFIVSLFGCLYAGAIPTPCPVPEGRRSADERVLSVVQDAQVSLLLTDREWAADVSRLVSAVGRADLPCLALDDSTELPDASDWRPPGWDPDSVAVLQYTSGSTREPRGARLTHRNLLANQEELVALLGTGKGARVGGWLPFHHDMGLSGQLLHPLWLGTTGVLMSTSDFTRRPGRWLRAVSECGVTVSGGPDIAYELCTRKVTDEELAELDLSGWQVAVNGSEPVRAETMDAFAERFAPAGFRPSAFVPAYGLAESTLLTAGRRAGTGGPPRPFHADIAELELGRLVPAGPGRPFRALVGCGTAMVPHSDLRIVDPDTGRVLPEDGVGEIWTRGRSVADGYWKRPLETRETFCGTTVDGETGFLRTGDLGALHGGELFVTGRIRDMMVLTGRNVYPQDVEHRVQQVSELFGATAVFTVEPDRDTLVVVQEVRMGRRYDLDLGALERAVRDCVARDFEVAAVKVVLVRPGTVRRTSSGKVQRQAMRRLFGGGRLLPLFVRG